MISVVQDEKEEVNVRLYNISITYDMYYYTPRMWLSGVDSHKKQLTNEEIFEDIMSDYANKTVTFESHPYLGISQASIHPCKHAEVMKIFIDMVKENGKKLEIHQALFLFLKFMNAVIPTIEYDFTVDLAL